MGKSEEVAGKRLIANCEGFFTIQRHSELVSLGASLSYGEVRVLRTLLFLLTILFLFGCGTGLFRPSGPGTAQETVDSCSAGASLGVHAPRGITNYQNEYAGPDTAGCASKSDPYPNVMMFMPWAGGDAWGICVGTVIGYNTLITAAHCVERGDDGKKSFLAPNEIRLLDYEKTLVFVNEAKAVLAPKDLAFSNAFVTSASRIYRVNEVPEKFSRADDIALIVFPDIQVNGKPVHPFGHLVPDAISCRPPAQGEKATLVGFMPFDVVYKTSKKWGTNTVTVTNDGEGPILLNNNRRTITNKGDSGGPLYLRTSSGRLAIAGTVEGSDPYFPLGIDGSSYWYANLNTSHVRNTLAGMFNAARAADPSITSGFPCNPNSDDEFAAFNSIASNPSAIESIPDQRSRFSVISAPNLPGSCVRWAINAGEDHFCCTNPNENAANTGDCGPVEINADDKVAMEMVPSEPSLDFDGRLLKFDHLEGSSPEDSLGWTDIEKNVVSNNLIAMSGQKNPSYLFTAPTITEATPIALYQFLPVYKPTGPSLLPIPGEGTATLHVNGIRDAAQAVYVQPDGKALIAGTTENSFDNLDDSFVLRLNPDQTVDDSFNEGQAAVLDLKSPLYTSGVILQNIRRPGDTVIEQRVVMLGVAIDQKNIFTLVRYKDDGSLDTGDPQALPAMEGFGEDQSGIVQTTVPTGGSMWIQRSLAIQADGKILAAGNYHKCAGFPCLIREHGIVARYSRNGVLDFSFGTNGLYTNDASDGASDSRFFSIAVEADAKTGNTLVDGRVALAGTKGNQLAVTVLDAAGNPAGTFAGPAGAQAYGVQFRKNRATGKSVITVAGTVVDSNTRERIGIILQLEPNGTLISEKTFHGGDIRTVVTGLSVDLEGRSFVAANNTVDRPDGSRNADGSIFHAWAGEFSSFLFSAENTLLSVAKYHFSTSYANDVPSANAISREGWLWTVGSSTPNARDFTVSNRSKPQNIVIDVRRP